MIQSPEQNFHHWEHVDDFEIVLELRTPAFDPANPVIESTWAIELPGGQRIGQPLTFSLSLFNGG